MTLSSNAGCMASSAPNPYGQPQSSPNKIYHSDRSQAPAPTSSGQQAARMPHDGGDKPFVHSNSLLATSYDAYIGGMSSDSELTTSGANRHHHHYHHRPYSSQSRVYHAHPVPRNSGASSSRLSHYSDSAPNAQQSAPNSFVVQQQQLNKQAVSMTPPANPISLTHQGSLSSSGSASASYLGAVIPSESPISPVMQQQQQQQQQAVRPKGGRQLPQRPFKQSMSIDQHSLGGQYQPLAQMRASSPAHHSSLSSHRNLVEPAGTPSDQIGYQPSQNYAVSQQRFNPHPNQYASSSQRNLRLEMEMVEKQAANLNLYDPTTNENPAARLPPTGSSRPPFSSSARQTPSVGSPNQAQVLIGSMSLDQQHHHHVDPFHHHHQQQQQQQQQQQIHQDLYPTHQHHHDQLASAPADWLQPIGLTSQHHLPRSAGHFKQTMSIDHYPVSSGLHQQHYSPGRASSHFSADQYHQIGSCTSSTPQSQIGCYDSSTNPAYYSPSSNQEHVNNLQENYYPPPYQQQLIEPGHQHQHQAMSSDHSVIGRAGSSSSATSLQQHQRQVGKPTLHHQVSSSSSTSNQSGSLKSGNVDNILDKQNSNEHQKSIPSASAVSSHYQQSPQHKITPTSRHDMLRRGHTSVTMPSPYDADLGGSQTTLSESGDLSLTRPGTTLGSQIGSLGCKRSAPGLRAASPSMTLEAGTSSGQAQPHHHQHHSTSSSHGSRECPGMRSESSTGLPNGSGGSSTLTKKSNSATQLSMTGTKKRLGFRKKQVTSFSVHRSEEVAPLEARHLVKQGSSVSEGDSSMSGDSSSRSWSNSNFKQQTSEELASMSFIDGLGKGQMISRQGLASPYLGDIQLSLCDRRGNLEVEVIRARNLQAKTNKVLPLTYVKLYLVKNRKCLAKAKTTLSNKRTLNPLFQQQLTFHEDYHGCILQSIVWGNFGKMDKKNFMGIAQISIDDLELSDTVISWYKLFLPSSLQTLPSKSLRHTLLSNSTESFTNTNNS